MVNETPEYMRLAAKICGEPVPSGFVNLLADMNVSIRKARPYGGLRSSQIVTLAWFLWQSGTLQYGDYK